MTARTGPQSTALAVLAVLYRIERQKVLDRARAVVVPLEPWEQDAVDRCRDRLHRAGRWDCTRVIDRMTTSELHHLAGLEVCDAMPADPQETHSNVTSIRRSNPLEVA